MAGFYIEDDGVGIPEADRETVLESGFSTASEGTGLGLAIVSEIVAAHDWGIHVTSSAEGVRVSRLSVCKSSSESTAKTMHMRQPQCRYHDGVARPSGPSDGYTSQRAAVLTTTINGSRH